MSRFYFAAAAMLAVASSTAYSHEGHAKEPKTTVALMSNEVIAARMRALGYTQVKVNKRFTLRYEIDAVKGGRTVVLELHPQTGVLSPSGVTSGAGGATNLMPREPVLDRSNQR